MASGAGMPPIAVAPTASAPVEPDPMRAYRACLHCRSRKTKCNLEANNGQPPCKRCQREQRECVLGESHRGGRRVRKKPKLGDAPVQSPASIISSSAPGGKFHLPPIQMSGLRDEQMAAYSSTQYAPSAVSMQFCNGPAQRISWSNSQAAIASPASSGYSNHASPSMAAYPTCGRPSSNLMSRASIAGPVRESIASVDLQNPSDALEILAHVADRAEDESPVSGQGNTPKPGLSSSSKWGAIPSPPKTNDHLYYKPVADGLISTQKVYQLFSKFEQQYHPYFPIVPRESFNQSKIPALSKAEPHLFSAILTVASKDDDTTHQTCYEHMQHLVSMILAGADADVEAVEALLLLSQWVSHRPQAEIAVGRGEEDRVAWMYIGTALRLGYFLGIDRTAFRGDRNEDPAKFNRKRLVWAFCYVCDRSVSVRLGKGFWARGPGPLSGLKASDFPSLQPESSQEDDWATVFQANLELTQIFSNVHDILYSSKGHGWKEMLEGRYAKHLDDFRTSIRHWNEAWNSISCSPHIKLSLRMSYDYLRLYVNAFAYQATISRAISESREPKSRPMPSIDAATPDARFIFEAIDAAKSLLSRVNDFVLPETLRYMPCTYYLFIIYSAVFLYKARSTTAMSEVERSDIRHMISKIIDVLQKASAGANHMGNRYSRLLQLLWRKGPKKRQPKEKPRPQSIDSILQPPLNQATGMSNAEVYDPNAYGGFQMPGGTEGSTGYMGAFSWLDLAGTCSYAIQNDSVSGSGGEMDDVLGDTGSSGISPYDMSLGTMADYHLLSDNNPNSNLIF